MFVHILGKTDIDNLRNPDIVTYGTYSSSEGYRMIDGNLPDRYKAFCRFGRSEIFLYITFFSTLCLLCFFHT